MDALEGDLSLGVVGVSTIVIGSFDGGWGLPVLILTLLLALKYKGVSLFRFSFGLGEVLRVASIASASLARISADFSFCCPSFGIPVESPVVIAFGLPVEAVFNFPIEILCCFPVEAEGTVLAYLAEGTFPFNLAEVALGVPLLTWTFSVRSALLCSLFSLGVGAILSSPVLAACPFSGVPFYSFFSVLPGVSCSLTFFSA